MPLNTNSYFRYTRIYGHGKYSFLRKFYPLDVLKPPALDAYNRAHRKSRSDTFHQGRPGRLSCFQLRRLAGDKWWLQLRLHGYTLRTHPVHPLALLPMRTCASANIPLRRCYNYQRYITLNCLPLTGEATCGYRVYALDNRRRIAR